MDWKKHRIEEFERLIEDSRELMKQSLEDTVKAGATPGHEYPFKCGQLEAQITSLIGAAERLIEEVSGPQDTTTG